MKSLDNFSDGLLAASGRHCHVPSEAAVAEVPVKAALPGCLQRLLLNLLCLDLDGATGCAISRLAKLEEIMIRGSSSHLDSCEETLPSKMNV